MTSGSFITIKIIILCDQGRLQSRVTVPEPCPQSPRSVSTCATTRCGGDEFIELSTVYTLNHKRNRISKAPGSTGAFSMTRLEEFYLFCCKHLEGRDQIY